MPPFPQFVQFVRETIEGRTSLPSFSPSLSNDQERQRKSWKQENLLLFESWKHGNNEGAGSKLVSESTLIYLGHINWGYSHLPLKPLAGSQVEVEGENFYGNFTERNELRFSSGQIKKDTFFFLIQHHFQWCLLISLLGCSPMTWPASSLVCKHKSNLNVRVVFWCPTLNKWIIYVPSRSPCPLSKERREKWSFSWKCLFWHYRRVKKFLSDYFSQESININNIIHYRELYLSILFFL